MSIKTDTPLRVVLDTNVLLSLYVFADSRFAPLRARVESGHWRALSNAACLGEWRRVLAYPEFALSEARQEAAYGAYEDRVEQVPPGAADAIALPRCRDRDDQKFLEVARDGGASMLITADKALLVLARRQKMAGRFAIITPEAALAIANVDIRDVPPEAG